MSAKKGTVNTHDAAGFRVFRDECHVRHKKCLPHLRIMVFTDNQTLTEKWLNRNCRLHEPCACSDINSPLSPKISKNNCSHLRTRKNGLRRLRPHRIRTVGNSEPHALVRKTSRQRLLAYLRYAQSQGRNVSFQGRSHCSFWGVDVQSRWTA